MPNDVTAIAVVLSFLILSVAFRQVSLHLKLKDLFEVNLKAAKRKAKPVDDEHLD
ncbi:hypothetical protein [Paenibacillus sp. N3.4]|uniref:hypothetical protein n=1 Tax=Paenibacillus sp. N3.4 TaxID=2603222 RepID=UPI0016509B22|nr:hypothetical protein [Paenibacillus sp. N3.4]